MSRVPSSQAKVKVLGSGHLSGFENCRYNIIDSQNGMHCRPPRKIKRYMTDPEEFGSDYRSKYGHMNLQELKLQVSAIDTLQEISLPPR